MDFFAVLFGLAGLHYTTDPMVFASLTLICRRISKKVGRDEQKPDIRPVQHG
jgi:hypothetical protein